MVAVSIFISIQFNLFFLPVTLLMQIPLLVFFIVMIYASIKNIRIKIFHKALAVAVISGDMLSVILSENSWIIK